MGVNYFIAAFIRTLFGVALISMQAYVNSSSYYCEDNSLWGDSMRAEKLAFAFCVGLSSILFMSLIANAQSSGAVKNYSEVEEQFSVIACNS